MLRAVALTAAVLAVAAACSHANGPSQRSSGAYDDLSHPPRHPEVRVGKYGIACLTMMHKTQQSNLSYRVDDLGKAGVPSLDASQLVVVSRIRQYAGTPTLRFAFIPAGQTKRFIVFDATAGPCADFAPGYWVMNSADPNAFFEPGDAPGFIHPIPGEVAPTRGPWMHP